MTTTPRQIDFLARAIVNRLEDRGLVEFGDAEAGIQIVVKTLQENFAVGEAIEREARQRLMGTSTREPSESALVEEMKRIAAERNFTL
ncbi:MAG: hypothetical protein ACXVIJ_05575 [Thermoanaerobaculia bacterium]